MDRTTPRTIRVGLVAIVVFGAGTLIWISRTISDNKSRSIGVEKSDERLANTNRLGNSDVSGESQLHSRMLSATPANVDKLDSSASDASHNKVTDNPDERDNSSRGDGAKMPAIKVITPDALRGLLRDCAGRGVGGCHALSKFAERIVSAGAEQDAGWPEWMEAQVLDDLLLSSAPNHFSEIGASCGIEGCIFYVAAESNLDLPERGSDRWLQGFESWLSKRPWTDELAGIEVGERLHSFAKSRIVGSATHPYIIWYVVRRRPT